MNFNNFENQPELNLAELEKRVEAIDQEMVDKGEGIDSTDLSKLAKEKTILMKKIASLKHEPISSDDSDKEIS